MLHASDAASFVAGHLLAVDGGILASGWAIGGMLTAKIVSSSLQRSQFHGALLSGGFGLSDCVGDHSRSAPETETGTVSTAER